MVHHNMGYFKGFKGYFCINTHAVLAKPDTAQQNDLNATITSANVREGVINKVIKAP